MGDHVPAIMITGLVQLRSGCPGTALGSALPSGGGGDAAGRRTRARCIPGSRPRARRRAVTAPIWQDKRGHGVFLAGRPSSPAPALLRLPATST
ncbi:hypothetical protein HVIM_04227 [Roseomonas mucosa]|nr:hypothetical protein HVIM_04227 [Roseomonas mucosa]QDD99170.1 hypothetical protein ADP8_04227 [Roseomonas mucosa]